MANAIINSYAVFKESFLILRKDKKMLLFPVLAGMACLIAILSFILPVFLAIDLLGLFSLLLIFIFYLAMYFISIFFASTMVIYASLRLRDSKPTARHNNNYFVLVRFVLWRQRMSVFHMWEHPMRIDLPRTESPRFFTRA